MTTRDHRRPDFWQRPLSRRELIKLATAAGLLAGCQPLEPLLTPTRPPAPTATPAPTAPPTPAPTSPPTVPSPTITPGPVVVRRPDVIKMFPAVPSTVVHAHHAGVWSGENLVPGAMRQMLDASITTLTGRNDARQAWSSLFAPDERIAIKVNVFSNGTIWTHAALAKAVTDALQDAGVPPEQIFVFDRLTDELQDAGYVINPDGAGPRCYGTDGRSSASFKVGMSTQKLSDILLNCHALINMPILKSHMIAGTTFALKNHFGTVNHPSDLHWVDDTIPALNALPEVKDRTRLVIGDVLTACVKHAQSFPYWQADTIGDSILMSFDPVAHDTVGLEVFKELLVKAGGNPRAAVSMSEPWLKNAAKAGLGAQDPSSIKRVELALK